MLLAAEYSLLSYICQGGIPRVDIIIMSFMRVDRKASGGTSRLVALVQESMREPSDSNHAS